MAGQWRTGGLPRTAPVENPYAPRSTVAGQDPARSRLAAGLACLNTTQRVMCQLARQRRMIGGALVSSRGPGGLSLGRLPWIIRLGWNLRPPPRADCRRRF